MGYPEGAFEECDVCETEAGTEADVEDDNIVFVGGADEFGVSGYESQGFTLSEILARKSVSEGVVDTAHLSQCEFSNCRHLPLFFVREILCWLVTEFC